MVLRLPHLELEDALDSQNAPLICVVWTGCFEKFLQMVLRWPRLELEVALDSQNSLLIGVNGFLIVTVIVGHHSDAARAPLQPLLVSLGAVPSALGGGLRWRCPDAAGGHFLIV
jgi:hypothetical protein